MSPRRSQRISDSDKGVSSNQCLVLLGQETATVVSQSPKRRKLGFSASSDDDDDGEDDECIGDSEAEQETTAPSKKGRKRDGTTRAAPKRYVKGKRGFLQIITDTPIDVLFEIFSYLEPLDLLRISRTTKDLRALLMSRSAGFVWERARLAMKDLPPFLDGMTEPQYANLLFDTHCHACGKHSTKAVQWEARLRLCKDCLQEGSIMTSNMNDLVALSNRYDDLITVTPKYQLRVSTGNNQCEDTQYFHLSTYRLLAEECASMEDQPFQAWLSAKQDKYSAFVMTCREYKLWSSSRRTARNSELHSVRHGRIASVIQRLEADGWAEDLKDDRVMDTVRKHKLVRQSKALTDRIWNNIRPTLTMVMTDAHAMLVAEQMAEKVRTAIARRMALLERLCKPLLAKMPDHQANPSASMIPYFEPFFSIIKNTPLEVEITAGDFSAALVRLSETCATWRRQRDADLKKIALENGRSDNLSLAVNAFTCTARDCLSSPSLVLHYPHFASHPCFVRCVLMGDSKEDTLVNVWCSEAITPVTKDVYNHLEHIVRMCGLDPTVATAEDMDAVKAFFTCSEDSCLGSSGVVMMDWRCAMGHTEAHLGRVKRVNDPGLISSFKRLEAADLTTEINSEWCEDPFICVHCGTTDLTSRKARAAHLFKHGGKEDVHFWKQFRRSSKSGHTSKYCVHVEENPL